MAGLSRQIQQLGECERSRVIFHVIVLLLFMIGILLMVLLMKEVDILYLGWLLAWYKCQHDDFILSVMENGNGGGRTWCCSGSRVPKAEIVYLCQVLLILSIVLASSYNLSNQQGDRQLWVALLSNCMGYLLPNPSIKSWVTSIARYRIIPPWITTREVVWRILPPSYPMPSIWQGTGLGGNPVSP